MLECWLLLCPIGFTNTLFDLTSFLLMNIFPFFVSIVKIPWDCIHLTRVYVGKIVLFCNFTHFVTTTKINNHQRKFRENSSIIMKCCYDDLIKMKKSQLVNHPHLETLILQLGYTLAIIGAVNIIRTDCRRHIS